METQLERTTEKLELIINALKAENERLQKQFDHAIDDCKLLKLTREENERLRDNMQCEQCSNDTSEVSFCASCWNSLAVENERLLGLINTHNEQVTKACQWMQENRGCSDYIQRGRRCPECPRDWALDAAMGEGE